MVLVLIPYLILVMFVVNGNAKISKFSKTKIIHNKCDKSTKLRDVTTKNVMECAKICSVEVDCRKYLYCSSTKSCTLYLDGTDCIMSGDATDCSCYRRDRSCDGSNCVCPWGYYGDQCQQIIEDCKEGYDRGIRNSQTIVTNIKHVREEQPYDVMCLLEYGGLTSILNRDVTCNVEHFNRTLTEYEKGFGEVPGNKWLGFEKILQMLDKYQNKSMEAILELHLISLNGMECKMQYRDFQILNTSSEYGFNTSLSNAVGGVTMCPDALLGGINVLRRPFSTSDSDYTGINDCANRFGAGWWFADDNTCTQGFLTGTMNGSGINNFWLNYDSFQAIHAFLVFI